VRCVGRRSAFLAADVVASKPVAASVALLDRAAYGFSRGWRVPEKSLRAPWAGGSLDVPVEVDGRAAVYRLAPLPVGTGASETGHSTIVSIRSGGVSGSLM